MKVHFANIQLQQCFENHRRAQRRWDVAIARKYIQRVELILDANDLNELRSISSLRLHPLSGQRDGQFAISLNNRWRIVFTYDSNEESVRILEVTNHYGD